VSRQTKQLRVAIGDLQPLLGVAQQDLQRNAIVRAAPALLDLAEACERLVVDFDDSRLLGGRDREVRFAERVEAIRALLNRGLP
jgi:hypothetical protein